MSEKELEDECKVLDQRTRANLLLISSQEERIKRLETIMEGGKIRR